MAVPMRVENWVSDPWIICTMHMLVMIIKRSVHMRMFVFEHFMQVFVLMLLGQMQPHTERHEPSGTEQQQTEFFTKDDERHRRADERSDGEIRARSRRTQCTEREDEQHEAESITDKAQRKRKTNVGGRRPRCVQ